MIKAILQLVASVAGYFLSERYQRERDQRTRDRIADEVARGDENAVNARLGRFRSLAWTFAALALLGAGCACSKAVYVREGDRARALAPGAVYTNTSDTVEWIVPRAVMARLVIANELRVEK